ncbi:hypothetical protein BJ165DRAFT_629896 [Panaeolus papilionaceus]|nr:hypothetical protein BJ165DRAFT_629896 [Panaeolus papilionaceus]
MPIGYQFLSKVEREGQYTFFFKISRFLLKFWTIISEMNPRTCALSKNRTRNLCRFRTATTPQSLPFERYKKGTFGPDLFILTPQGFTRCSPKQHSSLSHSYRSSQVKVSVPTPPRPTPNFPGKSVPRAVAAKLKAMLPSCSTPTGDGSMFRAITRTATLATSGIPAFAPATPSARRNVSSREPTTLAPMVSVPAATPSLSSSSRTTPAARTLVLVCTS